MLLQRICCGGCLPIQLAAQPLALLCSCFTLPLQLQLRQHAALCL
jgi:hypothetical protein